MEECGCQESQTHYSREEFSDLETAAFFSILFLLFLLLCASLLLPRADPNYY